MKIRIILKHLRFWLCRNYMRVFACFHRVCQNKIVFSSFSGEQYSDNPRAISEKLHLLCPDYRIIWIVDQNADYYNLIPEYVVCVPPTGMEKYKAIATASCFVYNHALENNIIKRKGQLFIQTWHGDRGFKKVLYDLWGEEKRPFPVMDEKLTDIAVSGSSFGTAVYRSAFRFKGVVMEVGSPRNDIFFHLTDGYIDSIKEKLGIVNGVNVLLYAPTFRDSDSDSLRIPIQLNRLLDRLAEKSGSEWIALVRAHHITKSMALKENDRVVNVSTYPDMADLLCITDFLITDYSSSIFDYYLTGRPCICFIPDETEYETKHRSFKVRPEESGVIIAKTQEELENKALSLTEQDYREACNDITCFFGTKETGNASERVIEKIKMHSTAL